MKRQTAPAPAVHPCAVCGSPLAPCGQGGQWFCVRHAPADFFPAGRA